MRFPLVAVVTTLIAALAAWMGVYWLAALFFVSPAVLLWAMSVRLEGETLVCLVGPFAVARTRLDEIVRVRTGDQIEAWVGERRYVFSGSKAVVAEVRSHLLTSLPPGLRWSEPLGEVLLGQGIVCPEGTLPVISAEGSTLHAFIGSGLALAIVGWRLGVVGAAAFLLLLGITLLLRADRQTLQADGGFALSSWRKRTRRYAPEEVRVISVDVDGVEIEIRGERVSLDPRNFSPGAPLRWLLARGGSIPLGASLRELLGGEPERRVEEVIRSGSRQEGVS